MTRCDLADEMEELVIGVLAPARDARLRAHAAACPSCAARLSCLQQQRDLFLRRAAAPCPAPAGIADVFARIELGRRRSRSRWHRASLTVAGVTAAAAALVLAWQQGIHLPLAMTAQGEAAASGAGNMDVASWPAPEPCEPVSCSQDASIVCEPVTCAPQGDLIAQSAPAACVDPLWTELDPSSPGCVSETRATP